MLSADAKSAILLRVPSLNKVELRNFPLLHFPRWFCLVNGQLAISLRRVKRSVICKFQCFWLFDIQQCSVLSLVLFSPSHKSPLSPKENQLSVNCCVFILIFHQNAKTITVLYIYSTWGTSQSLPKNVPYWQNGLTLPRRHFWAYFLKCFLISLLFSILATGKHIYV